MRAAALGLSGGVASVLSHSAGAGHSLYKAATAFRLMTMTASPTWSLKTRPLGDYPAFQRATDCILYDKSITDADLQEQAKLHLHVFDSPALEKYNRPAGFDLAFKLHPDSKLTAKHLLEAFYQTAQDLGMKRGGRYILAGICACAHLVSESEGASPGPMQSEQLASELSNLACVWYAHLLRPQGRPGDADGMSVATRQKVLERDSFTCFKTGEVDVEASPSLRGDRQERLITTPILRRTFPQDEQETERDPWTVKFLQQYLEIACTPIPADSPANSLLLSSDSDETFRGNLWTLKPTQDPTRFKVVDQTGPEMAAEDVLNDGDYVCFANHSCQLGTDMGRRFPAGTSS